MAQGCKEQLVIDTVVTEDAKKNKRNLHTAYIDYKKAFDSVPHSWLAECLSIYKVDPRIVNLLKTMMSIWETTLVVNSKTTPSEPINIKIRRGIFQGDALSALWFCMAMNPLSNELRALKSGYKISNSDQELSHLAYMDDIKLYAESKEGLKRLIRTTEECSNDIEATFGLDKCRTNNIVRGKWQQGEDFTLLQRSGGGTITSMDKNEAYKYLGFLQSQGIDSKSVKQQLTMKMQNRVKAILKTQLSAINKIKATNTLAVPVVANSFGVINWSPAELDEST